PLDTTVEIVVDKSLRGMEGPLPTGEEQRVELATYGAIDVHGVECGTSTPHRKCAARGYLSINFTNRVSYRDLKAHVKLEGAPLQWGSSRSDDDKTQYVGLNAKLRPAQSYTAVVTAGLKDEYGQVLARDVRMPFETDDEWPSV